MPTARSRAAKALLLVSLVAFVWSLAVAATGGFRVDIGSLRISSRQLRNPLAFAVVTAVIGWMMSTRDERIEVRQTVVSTFKWLAASAVWIAPIGATAAAISTTVVGITKGSFVAAGSDVYGYVSQAHAWAHGGLRKAEPLLAQLGWPYAVDVLSPLGYAPAPDRETIVPVYSAGLPLVMAAFEWLGGPTAVFYVVPLLGGVAVMCTYLLGSRLGYRAAGLAGALLLATSPPYLFQLMLPMSDVPVTAWWAVALVLLTWHRPSLLFLAGISTSLAILTRPNLAPAAVVPALWLAGRAIHGRTVERSGVIRFVSYVAGVIPGCLAVALINQYLYGSPLESGYGRIGRYFSTAHVVPNIKLYTSWMWQSQTPAIFLAVTVPIAALLWWRPADADASWRRSLVLMWTAFTAVIFALYMPYTIFDGWFWLRFVLPAWPILLVMMSVAILAACAKLPSGLDGPAATAAIVAVLWHNVVFVNGSEIFSIKRGEQKTVEIGRYIREHLPERAVFLSMQQSGGVRYYSGRLTIRYDFIPKNELDRVVADLQRLGYHPYVILEQQEDPYFMETFKGRSRLAALDWPPVVTTQREIPTRIFDLVDPDSQARRETVRIF